MEWFPRNFIQSEVIIYAIRNNLICWLNAQPYRFSSHFAAVLQNKLHVIVACFFVAKETGNLILPPATHMSDVVTTAINYLLHEEVPSRD